MIDFSQYPEEPIFRTDGPLLEEPDRRISDFTETPFEKRRLKYIQYLNDLTISLKDKINNVISGYGTGPGDTSISNAIDIVNTLTESSPASFFSLNAPKLESGNCLGTDMAYDFYRNTLEFASKIEGLSRYDETYITVFEKAYLAADQIFNKIGTRGQLYGYVDSEIIVFGNFMTIFIDELKTASTWAAANTIIDNRIQDFNIKFTTFKNNIIQGASDIRLLVEPIVRFLNITLRGSDSLNQNWGGFAIREQLQAITNQFNVSTVSYQNDYHITDASTTSQIFEQMRGFIKEDGSNFELMIMKAIRMSFDELQITQDLEATALLIIIPNYNP